MNSTTIQAKEVGVEITTDVIDNSAFSTTADGDGNFWKVRGAGLNSATVTIRGRWDNGEPPTDTGVGNNGLRAGLSQTVSVALAAGVSFSLTGIVSRSRPSANVADGVDFETELQSNGAVTYPS